LITIRVYDPAYKPDESVRNEIGRFLLTHLQNFGDPLSDIEKAIAYALKEAESFGGFILVSRSEACMTGVVVVNSTGMKDYIPENILVYIATHKDYRGQGIGKSLMQKAIEVAEGNIALHVEPDNPARFLYEKVGFTSKYIEMRYLRKG